MEAQENNSPETSVRVAVRIRPQISREIIDMCKVCISVSPDESQVWLGKDKAYTFDYIFDTNSRQSDVYDTCVRNLVDSLFFGYNATVLAYGQTGSGKTYTMGTGFDHQNGDDQGIVARAMHHIFDEISRRRENQQTQQTDAPCPDFKVTTQFLELYNEDIIDLLNEGTINPKQIRILEENGQIQLAGVTSRPVHSVEDAFESLRYGALARTTASTKMNTQSSRSHAIFTISIRQSTEDEVLSAKFHFVDLAGSERLKRTGATGERAKEGIAINSGLLCLGNVISALGDTSRKVGHVPYRDSKLTRLLQDSLGGNSQTIMIACVSPSDRDFMETSSTLRYANRARNIKNKVTVNQDITSQTIALLTQENQALKLELAELRQGKRLLGDDGSEYVNDMYQENAMLLNEIQALKTRIKALQSANECLVARNAESVAGNDSQDVKDIVHKYLIEIEELRVKLLEMEETCSNLRKRNHMHNNLDESEITSEKVIEEAKREVRKLKSYTKLMSNGLSNDVSRDSSNSNETDGEDDFDSSTEEVSEESMMMEKTNQELDQLNEEISTKELLIAELEKSQKKMQSLKQHYESKLIQLQSQIADIERERDQVLMKLAQEGNKDERSKKVQDDYDKKLKALQMDLRKLQDAKKEHAVAMRNQARYEQQVRKLRNEVCDIKRQKVTVMNKMREEVNRHRLTEMQSNKRIAQLAKQERLKDVRIKNLEVENNRMKLSLRRKDAEVRALKTKTGRTCRCPKSKWTKLESDINDLIMRSHRNGHIVDTQDDDFFPTPPVFGEARRMTRTPQELLFDPASRGD